MTEKKLLNEEELEKVSGGHGNGSNDPHYDGFSGYLNMYSLEVGKEYYFTMYYDGVKWFRARVDKTEESSPSGPSYRYHEVYITDPGNTTYVHAEKPTLRGDTYAAYTNKNF